MGAAAPRVPRGESEERGKKEGRGREWEREGGVVEGRSIRRSVFGM